MNTAEFPLPLAAAIGEVIFESEMVTTYALTANEKETDPEIKKNMRLWSQFMAGQYTPATFDQVVEQCIDKEYTWHCSHAHEGIRGDSEAGYETGMSMSESVEKGITGFHITNRMFGEGARVVNYWHMTGTHTGEFFGIPATGKAIDLRGISISAFHGGKLVEEWEFSDDLVEKVRALSDAATK